MYIASTTTVLAYIPVAKVDLAAPVPQVMQAGACPALRTRSWRIEMRPLLPFGAPKVRGVRLVLRSLSPGLNAYSDGGLRGVGPRPTQGHSKHYEHISSLEASKSRVP
jgi:hypothetical protein